ncbi:hypothetical protein V490_00447 [Pseudogymnoascus sp. VKM F-3557]|nr:hypothetical protein V490_00447 [Pseudogymnoascus sp. VKM F-3557]
MDVSSLLSISQSRPELATQPGRITDEPSASASSNLQPLRNSQNHQKKTSSSSSNAEPVSNVAKQLASKSNYQRIEEGNYTTINRYPKEHIRQVFSKRVAHSAAERGRRERLKKALQKLAELMIADRDEDLGGALSSEFFEAGALAAQTGNKAAIVEMAVEYISSQRKTVVEMKSRLKECQRLMVDKGGC